MVRVRAVSRLHLGRAPPCYGNLQAQARTELTLFGDRGTYANFAQGCT